MKKIFLYLFVLSGLLFATSCSSSDDDNEGGDSDDSTASVTIDGTSLTFDTIVVEVEEDDEVSGFITTVSMINATDTSVILTFSVYDDNAGSDSISFMSYTENSMTYTYTTGSSLEFGDTQNLTSFTNVNSNGNLEGTFSGVLSRNTPSGFESVSVTNGSFDINY